MAMPQQAWCHLEACGRRPWHPRPTGRDGNMKWQLIKASDLSWLHPSVLRGVAHLPLVCRDANQWSYGCGGRDTCTNAMCTHASYIVHRATTTSRMLTHYLLAQPMHAGCGNLMRTTQLCAPQRMYATQLGAAHGSLGNVGRAAWGMWGETEGGTPRSLGHWSKLCVCALCTLTCIHHICTNEWCAVAWRLPTRTCW